MKKLLALGCILFATANASAKVSSQVSMVSDYIWRGLSQTGAGVPAVQGTLNYSMDNGVTVGLWASNHAVKYDFAQYLNYGFGEGMMGLNVTLFRYTFPQMTGIEAQEVVIAANVSGIALSFGYMPKYFGAESTSMYLNAAYGFEIEKGFNLNLALGNQMFSDEKKAATTNYMDYKVGFAYSNEGFTTEIGYTNTTRQDIDTTTGTKTAFTDKGRDEKTYLSFSKAF